MIERGWAIFLLLIVSMIVLVACGVNFAERNNTGNAQAELGVYDEAISIYQQAQVVLPDRAESYFNAAAALSATSQFSEAVATLEQALKTADADLTLRVYYNLGNVYLVWGRYADAIANYQKVLRHDPNHEDARHNMELALRFILIPTPTALEQRVEPEEGYTDPDATPTNNPAGRDGPTPTPPPQEGPPDPSATPVGPGDEIGGILPSTPIPRPEGRLTVEEAERQLDAVMLNQQTLREFLQEIATPDTVPDKDW